MVSKGHHQEPASCQTRWPVGSPGIVYGMAPSTVPDTENSSLLLQAFFPLLAHDPPVDFHIQDRLLGGVSGNEWEAMPASPTAARMHILASPQPPGKQTCTQAHKGKQILTLSTGVGQRDQPKPFTVHHQADFQELCTQCEVGGLSGEPPKMHPTKKLPSQGTGKL